MDFQEVFLGDSFVQSVNSGKNEYWRGFFLQFLVICQALLAKNYIHHSEFITGGFLDREALMGKIRKLLLDIHVDQKKEGEYLNNYNHAKYGH